MHTNQPGITTVKPTLPFWAAILIVLFLAMFMGWVTFYLAVLRLPINHWAAQYVGAYLPILHLVPIFAPLACIFWIPKLAPRQKAGQLSGAIEGVQSPPEKMP